MQEYILDDVENAIKSALSAYELSNIIKTIDDISECLDNFEWPKENKSALYDEEEEYEDIEEADLEDRIYEYCKILSRKLCSAVSFVLISKYFSYGLETINSLQDSFKVSDNLYNVLASKEEKILEKINELMTRLYNKYSEDYKTYFSQ